MVELLQKKSISLHRFEQKYKQLSRASLRADASKSDTATLQRQNSAIKNAQRIAQIELVCNEQFATPLRVKRIVADALPTGTNIYTTIFSTTHHTMYALCTGDASMQYADVKSTMKSMGLEVEAFLPPYADTNYFKDFGLKKYQQYFPSRANITAEDTAFYETLAPYSPALVQIKRIKGAINQYDEPTKKWHVAVKYSYQRLKVTFK